MGIVRTLLAIIHIIILLFLGGILMNAYVPPKIFPYFNFLSLGFPILMITSVLLCIFWIFSFKKRAIFFLLISVLFLTPVRRWINYSAPKSEKSTFKMVTFNNKVNDFGKENVENYIESFHPDVVMLQEAGYKKLGNPELSDLENIFHCPIVSFYTKYKIVKKEQIVIGGNGDAMMVDVEIDGKIIRFINVYLEPFQLHKSMVKPTENYDENEEKFKILVKKFIPVFKIHQEQVAILRDIIKSSPYPIILGGDFNSVPNSYEYYHLGENLQDAFLEAGLGSATSFHDYKFPIRIDYLFSSEEIKPISYRVDRTQKLSDHYPIVAEFSFK